MRHIRSECDLTPFERCHLRQLLLRPNFDLFKHEFLLCRRFNLCGHLIYELSFNEGVIVPARGAGPSAGRPRRAAAISAIVRRKRAANASRTSCVGEVKNVSMRSRAPIRATLRPCLLSRAIPRDKKYEFITLFGGVPVKSKQTNESNATKMSRDD